MNTIENTAGVMAYRNSQGGLSGIGDVRVFNGTLAPVTAETTDGMLLDMGMNFEMSKQEIRVLNPDGISDPWVDDKNKGVVARDLLTHERIYTGAIVGDGFTFTQNDPIVDAIRQLQDAGLLKVNVGGSLDNHTKCFVHCTIGEEYKINGDPHRRGVLFRWAHDGSASLSVKPGSTRLFCLNQVPSFGTSWLSIRHTKSAEVKMAELQGVVVKAIASLDEYDRLMERLMDIKITDQAFKEWADSLIPMDDKVKATPEHLLTTGQKRSRTMVQNKRAAVRDIYFGSPTQENLYGTAAGAFHAAVEAFDHRFAGNRDARLLAGQDVEFKQRAANLALAL